MDSKPAGGPLTTWVFVIDDPTEGEMHLCDTRIQAHSQDEADRKAAKLAGLWSCKLWRVGTIERRPSRQDRTREVFQPDARQDLPDYIEEAVSWRVAS